MKYLDSLIMAFSIYSVIPMPRREWKQENMRYALAFFPVVGAVTGALSFLVRWLAQKAGFGAMVCAAVFTLSPVILTGGIHMDGFMDTADALSSRQDRERKLAILKDPHIGAFAALACAGYLLLYFAFSAEMGTEEAPRAAWLMIASCVLSRALSGFLALTLPSARPNGMLDTIRGKGGHKDALAILSVFGMAAALVLIVFGRWKGTAAVIAAAVTALLYRRMAMKHFGGVTGDLSGFFLQCGELAMLMTLVCR